MSIQISIGLGDDNVSADALDQHMAALGFSRASVRSEKTALEVMAEVRQAESAEQQTAEPAKTTRTRKAKDETKPAAAEQRPPEDDAATQAQDAADEKAEVDAAREPEKALTVDDIRGAMKGYVDKFGMAAAQEDGVGIFVDALGKPPANEPAWKVSLLAELPQEQIKKAFDAWTSASAGAARYQKRG